MGGGGFYFEDEEAVAPRGLGDLRKVTRASTAGILALEVSLLCGWGWV